MSKPRRSRERAPAIPEVAWKLLHDEEVDQTTWDWLAFGLTMKGDITLHEPSLEEHWETYGDEILAQWILDRPGSRPRAWWYWTNPAGKPWTDTLGLPCPFPKDESQAEYLRRHDLLLPEEVELLAATAGDAP